MKRHKQTAVYTQESRIFYGAVFVCICSIVLYMYFVSTSVMHVVMRKELDSEIALLNSKVSGMEATYIDMQHSMSNEFATLQGFVPIRDKVFIDLNSDTLVLSRN